MNLHLLPFLFLAAIGAGCASATPTETDPPTPPVTETPTAVRDDICRQEPLMDDIGSIRYPTDSRYAVLPHLGQVFTAIECDDLDRAGRVAGFVDKSYTAGVLLSWGDTEPPLRMKEALTSLGFVSVTASTWKATRPFTVQDLNVLRQAFISNDALETLEFEDCVRCG
ncbi:hypothetical protein KJ781_00190 [Patescibacteria group bacterium]|nr:hypothetical protein [Patescibacteria group bacterium]MBU1448771.1 hypothetical protein [Patescibacteria group bacterium]MBU2613403.1 hypothetical protein [Patescibacteria group bacterium]